MKREELIYGHGVADSDFISYVYDNIIRTNPYNYTIRFINKVKDYEKDKRATNEDLMTFIFHGRTGTHKTDIIDEFLQLLFERLDGHDGDPDDVAIGILDLLVRYGEEHYDSNKDEMKDFLFNTIPDLSEEASAAFVSDELLSEEGLALKSSFWDKME